MRPGHLGKQWVLRLLGVCHCVHGLSALFALIRFFDHFADVIKTWLLFFVLLRRRLQQILRWPQVFFVLCNLDFLLDMISTIFCISLNLLQVFIEPIESLKCQVFSPAERYSDGHHKIELEIPHDVGEDSIHWLEQGVKVFEPQHEEEAEN